MKQKRKSVRVQVSDELHQAISKKSEQTGVSVSHVVRRALEMWVADALNVAEDADGERKKQRVAG